MSIIRSRIIFLVFLLPLFWGAEFALAEDHGSEHAPAPEHGQEAPSEGGGEAHGAQVHVSPLMEVESKVQELSAKIKSKKAFLQIMLEDKNRLKDNSPALKAKIQDIVKEHAELRRLSEEYEKQLSILKYRFPERNTKAKKKHEKIEIKSVIEMEQAMTVDGKLNRNMRKLRSQYGSEAMPAAATGESKEVPSVPASKAPAGSIEDSGSILLQK